MHSLTDATLQSLDCQTDSLGLCRFIDSLAASGALTDNRYHAVFMTHDMQDAPLLIGAAGRLLSMQVTVSRAGILGTVDLLDKTLYTARRTPASPYESVPFAEVYDVANELFAACKDILPAAFANVPMMGGERCVLLSETPQRILLFYLPEYCLFGNDGHFQLFLSGHLDAAALIQPTAAGNLPYPRPRIGHIQETPDKAGYMENLGRVLTKLRAGELQKIVYARKCVVTAAEPFDAIAYAAYLAETLYQEYFYLFRHGEDGLWSGVTPGIIFRTGDGLGRTKILAGTRKRTADAAQNELNVKDLVSDKKEVAEHEAALHFMYDTLCKAGLGETEIERHRVVLETPYSYHLRSDIAVHLHKDVTPFDILRAVYPPATVWGIPVDRTELALQENEPFDREFYSGTYGFVTLAGQADFAQFIRSVRLDPNQVTVFGGGGIMPEADPASEWAETVGKMRPFLGFFRTDD